MVEIYNEQIIDLLPVHAPSPVPVKCYKGIVFLRLPLDITRDSPPCLSNVTREFPSLPFDI